MLLVHKFARIYNLDWHMIKLDKKCICLLARIFMMWKEDERERENLCDGEGGGRGARKEDKLFCVCVCVCVVNDWE